MMEDEDVVAGLRRITLTEPPLGFDPDDVATRASRRQRGRRATIAAGLGTAAVAAVAITVFARGGTPPPAPPALSPTPPPPHTVSSSWPPSEPSQRDAIRVSTPIAKRLDEVFPTLLPNATDVSPATANISFDGLDYVAAVKWFRDAHGKFFVSVYVTGKDSPRVTRPENVPCESFETCNTYPQTDGSVVLTKLSLLQNGVNGMRVVMHFRTDGSVVRTDTTNTPDGGGGHTDYPLTFQQLTTLATDPAFRIEK